MKLKVELIWYGGLIVDDDEQNNKSGAEYHLLDADTGLSLCETDFGTAEELESYIAIHYSDCERWIPPPAPAEEAKRVDIILEMFEADKLDTPQIKKVVHEFLVNQFYQSSYPEQTQSHIRQVIKSCQ